MAKCQCNKDIEIRFAKVKGGATIPSKRDEDAGYDIYPCFDNDHISISPNETINVPTGIASSVDSGYYFQIQERGSTGSIGMKYGAGVIDSGYRGEWFIPITNCSKYPILITKNPDRVPPENAKKVTVYPYNKAICQMVVLPVPKTKITEVPYEELLKIESERGTGSLGSSNK